MNVTNIPYPIIIDSRIIFRQIYLTILINIVYSAKFFPKYYKAKIFEGYDLQALWWTIAVFW